jgi:nifR3 family TIM-barrel protein
LGADFIDINMGCPAPKVANNGGGSALMKNPKLAGEIVKAVKEAVNLPVTAKIRSGWDKNNITATEVAKAAEQAGADAITVHARTRDQMYAPPVDLSVIREVKQAVKIPVVGNGDVTNYLSAKRMYEETGCDYIMVGRAAMGNPFIFTEINRAFLGQEAIEFSLEERLRVLKEQVRLMRQYKGDRTAFLEARKHTAWYLRGVRGASKLRKLCGEINNFSDIEKICEIALASDDSV